MGSYCWNVFSPNCTSKSYETRDQGIAQYIEGAVSAKLQMEIRNSHLANGRTMYAYLREDIWTIWPIAIFDLDFYAA